MDAVKALSTDGAVALVRIRLASLSESGSGILDAEQQLPPPKVEVSRSVKSSSVPVARRVRVPSQKPKSVKMNVFRLFACGAVPLPGLPPRCREEDLVRLEPAST